MSAPRIYRDSRAAAAAFVRAGRRSGAVEVLGGGWWRVAGWARPVQGEVALARELERRGKLRRLGDGRAQLLATSPGPTDRPSDECPQCSRIGAGPLCKAHRLPAEGDQ